MTPASSGDSSIDWHELMLLGLGHLHLAPQDFWQLTPKELHACVKARFGLAYDSRPMKREELDRLLQAFPDKG